MALFQKSVLNKYLKGLDESFINQQYEVFKKYFLHPEIQDNIRSSKEEQFQATFLNELFVKVFGYTLNPNQNYNLTTEFKNVKNAKKADGAILQNGKAVGVIELKGMNTTSLDKVEGQAFGYKNNQPDAVYVITSNFEKLRFYIDDAVSFEEFNLFHLSLERFKILYLCLAKDNIFIGLPKQMKDTSLAEEENITKKLYKDYSTFKNDLFNSIVKLNPQFDKLLLFKKTQKLLDRFLFIFFSEDGGLLPPNSIKAIVDQWVQLRDELDEYTPLYNRFKKYFGYMDTGYKGKKHDIFAYNGGLFAADEILDTIKIDDTLLYTHTQKLSRYDFKSEVDVNILGHIFEHSLNEIEEVTAELAGQTIDKSKTKRKKDGVFYTPKYITKYIVENTVGKLCEDKKTELNIDEAEYNKDRKGRNKATLKKLKTQLETYRNWLLGITICDPACGSGAFLNQALEFLIEEHTYIDELETKLLGGSFVFPNVENAILENNLYGVDINEESIDIAKLSLWLRSAKPNRKLNSLNSNIKCGNSLIDDKEVAGDKAFDWKLEFPKVFEKGGFDVVIGNPPYVNLSEFSTQLHKFLHFRYKSIHTGYNDLMYYFLYKSVEILNTNGLVGVITSNYFIGNDYAKGLRLFLNKHIDTLINFNDFHVFKDANVHTAILTMHRKSKYDRIRFFTYQGKQINGDINLNRNFIKSIHNRSEISEKWILADNESANLIKKITEGNGTLGEISSIVKGSETGKNSVFTIDSEVISEFNIEQEVIKPCVKNSDIYQYVIRKDDKYIIYADNDFSQKKYPNAYRYLESNKELLLDRRGPKTGEYEWWRLHRPSVKGIFEAKEKILVPYRASSNRFGYDTEQLFNNGGDVRAIQITSDRYLCKYVIALLNSSLLNWHYGFIGKPKGKSREYFNKPLSLIPIVCTDFKTQNAISDKVESIISDNDNYLKKINRFLKRLTDNLNIEKPSKKLESFYKYDFKTFVTELKKKKVILSLTQQDEWEDYFKAYTTEINTLQAEINQIDREIDKMVYELYGLTEDEIKIVEGA